MRLGHPAILLVLACSIFSSCSDNRTAPDKKDFLAGNLDTTISPSDNFFLYANGGWIKRTAIPEEESSWGVGNLVQEELYSRLKKINEDAIVKHSAAGTMEQKIGDFWYTGMDTVALEQQGLHPLRASLASIDDIRTVNDLVNVAADFHKKGINVLFSDYVYQDAKNSELMAYQLMQGGLGMPNRDYYFNTDDRTKGVRQAYRNYLEKTLRQLGNDSAAAAKNAGKVFDLEARLARSSRKLAALRDPEKNYHKMDLATLGKLSGKMNWPVYLERIGVRQPDSVIVGQPEFYSGLDHELSAVPLEDWKNYLRVQLLMKSAPYLDTATYNNYFEYRKKLSGASRQRPRWKRVLDTEEGAMGEAVGQLFVKEYFNAGTKKRYSDLVEAVRDAYRERIRALSWMSDSTKTKALEKLARITPKVGYPDKWKDFSSLEIKRDAYLLNVQRANQWWHQYDISKLGKPVDRTEWEMSPQTYNAYYNPSNNEIVLPAGIFAVPGTRDEQLDDAFVYGYAAASTIGHEITHGFDDQGRQFDDKGNLANWWSEKDSAEFVNRAKKIIAEFNAFNPVDTLHVNGEATQGENIADLGGLLIGLDAFKKTNAYKEGKKIGGQTPLQRYFLGYAYGWMLQQRKESLGAQVMTDVHAPAAERVNGPMVNIPEFYDAFGVKKGSRMYREDSLRVKIW